MSAREVLLVFESGDARFERAMERAVVVADGEASVEVTLRRTQTRTTDATGRFAWPALPGGRYLLVRGSGAPATDGEWFDLPPGAALDREFGLIGHQIEFQVAASDGRLLAGLRLQLLGAEHGATVQCDLDSRGRGTATGVVPGRYQVAVIGGWTQRSTLTGEVEVPRAAPIAPVSVQVAPAGR